jgi:16S rRNA (guanine527-N7)-methyltransferase
LAAIGNEEVEASLSRVGLATTFSETLAQYLTLLDQWNRVHNLTGIRRRDELMHRHLVESLALLPCLHGRHVADVGTGAGLPGLPLSISCPDRHFTLVESRRKRVSFLRHVAATLKLTNVTVQHCRVEALTFDEPFSTVLARAVAPPSELLSLCKPLLAPDGRLLILTSTELGHEMIRLAGDMKASIVDPGPRLGLKSTIVSIDRES